MHLNISYEILTKALGNIASVVEDTMSSDEMKNIIFKVSKEETKLIGINQLITYRKRIFVGDFRVEFDETDKLNEAGELLFQINSKELTGFLNTFKSVRRTVPTDVIFEFAQGGLKVEMTVIEDSLEDAEKKNKSKWVFENSPIKQNALVELSQELPVGDGAWSAVETNKILFYTANMLPILSNEGTNTLYNVLTFADDFVVAFNQKFNTLMQNHLPKELKGIGLNYKAVSFMKNVICTEAVVNVSKTTTQLVFTTSDSEAFIRFLTKLPMYKSIVDSFQDNHGIVVDRQYLKDVLKRLSLVNESITFTVSPETMQIKVSNTKFSQEIPILNTKAMEEFGEVKLKVRPQVLSEGIIGDDSQFSPETFIYFVKGQNGGYTTIFTDATKQWLSIATLR